MNRHGLRFHSFPHSTLPQFFTSLCEEQSVSFHFLWFFFLFNLLFTYTHATPAGRIVWSAFCCNHVLSQHDIIYSTFVSLLVSCFILKIYVFLLHIKPALSVFIFKFKHEWTWTDFNATDTESRQPYLIRIRFWSDMNRNRTEIRIFEICI